MTTGQSIRTGTKWLFIGNLGIQLAKFGFGIALARLLFPEDFGLVVTIQVFTGFVSLLASGGMGQALVRSKSADEKDFQVVFTIQLAIGITVYAFFFTIAPWFPIWFDNPLYTDLLRVSAITFILRPFINIHSSWLHREMRFRKRSVIGLISAIISGTGSISMALAGLGVWSLIFGGIIGSVLTIILISRVTPISPRLIFDSSRARQFSKYGIKVILNDIMLYLRRQTSNLIISQINGPHMVGLFNKADSLAKTPFIMIGSSVYQPIFREMAKSQNDTALTKYLYLRSISLLTVYTGPFYIGLYWLAEPFIRVVYGENWVDAAEPMQILALAGLFYCIENPCGAVLAANNRLGRELAAQTTTWIMVAILTYTGLNWGIVGVAWGLFVSQAYQTLLMHILTGQCINTGTKDLMLALKPGVILNGILIITLSITHSVLTSYLPTLGPAWYLVAMTIMSGLVYVIAFLFLPIESLASESLRWRKILRFSS